MGRAENQELKRAILAYDLATADRALRAGASPEVLIGERRTRSPLLASSGTGSFAPDAFRGLHLAAYDDDAELAALLLLHGANPHAEIYPRVLPISIAAQHNHR